MPKTTAKSGIILINGYNFSTFATAYDGVHNPGMIDVTGFGDGGQNFVPGLASGKLSVAMLWDTTTPGSTSVMSAFPTGVVTILPEGYVLGNPSVSMPFMQGNYSPAGTPAGAIQLGTIAFEGSGPTFRGLENGWALAHATITSTTTGTGFTDPTGLAITAICGASLHIWTACAADTYVVKVQHSATLGGTYTDLITFTANGSAITSERQVIASSLIQPFRRVLATRAGAAANPFGFTVHFWHA